MIKIKKKGTVQLGMRLDNELMEQIQRLAEWEEIDKNSWIKRAISSAVQDSTDEMTDQVIEDYIKSRIDKTEFLKYMDDKNVPKDIQYARKMNLNKIVGGNS